MDKWSACYLDSVRCSLSGSSYAGEDIRFTDDFESLEARINDEHSMLGSGRVDWVKVREACEVILRTQSRDLRVACWLAWALYQCEAFPGLLAGVGVLRYLCVNHWQPLHPQKPGTRSAALVWLLGRLEKVLVEEVSIKNQLSLFQQLSDHLAALDEVTSKYLGEEAPLLLPLRRRLARMLQLASQGESKPKAVVAQVKEVAAQFFSQSSVDSEKEARKALATQQQITQSLCAWWLRQKATDPRALRLSRTVLWLTIEARPECNAEHITVLRSMPMDKLNAYKARFEQGKYADLIVDIEQSIALAPFWFDGQRMVCECLQALGADAAILEVEVHLALFLQRVPGLTELRFHDGSPFADVETKSWILNQVLPHMIPAQPDRPARDDNVQPAWDVALKEIIPTLPRDGFKKTTQVLVKHLKNAQAERDRFFWKFSIAQLCYRAKKYELAKVCLETLDNQLRESGLESWESEAFVEVSRLLYRCYEVLPVSQESRLIKDDLYRRLCQYDFENVLNRT